ncbi:MAG TPA: Uma2 family endonuclease [Acidobacteriota bacterium]|nr:Uma2 family endonuclease [Acidobacteriota bacterium]HNB71434.1 Uma2 family endonuclease [Acidobacteriota bacterium]HNC42612.1 Uma2 family endonuclease [Acidobacteriota bacterium]HND18876.1 Uma2 family endonuclease [Acidobacteriota bacterium]HNG94620.1 Uma2 family endonuclease [Acidobacteriota bacterium]
MSTEVKKRRYTLEEYYALEQKSEGRYEFWNGEVYAMAGASPEHELILGNLIAELKQRLRGRSCVVYSSNLRVKVPELPPYRYPDLTALCETPEFVEIGGVKTLVNPALIVEILSPSTEAFDRGDKFTLYKSIPSFCEYLLIAQHRPHVSQYVKQANSAFWMFHEVNALSATVDLKSVNCTLDVSELYQGVEFSTSQPPFPITE